MLKNQTYLQSVPDGRWSPILVFSFLIGIGGVLISLTINSTLDTKKGLAMLEALALFMFAGFSVIGALISDHSSNVSRGTFLSVALGLGIEAGFLLQTALS